MDRRGCVEHKSAAKTPKLQREKEDEGRGAEGGSVREVSYPKVYTSATIFSPMQERRGKPTNF